MPRKDGYSSNERRKSANPRFDPDRPKMNSGVGPTFNDIKDAMQPVGEWFDNGVDLWTGQQSYSDFTSRYNQLTKGLYSTFANGIPLLSNMHNALLGRDSAEDYLKNNGLDWKDMEGYNDYKLLGRTNSAINGLSNQIGSYLTNIGNDLGKLYSGQTSKISPSMGYSSRMMDTW